MALYKSFSGFITIPEPISDKIVVIDRTLIGSI